MRAGQPRLKASRLDPRRAVVVVVDLQERLVPAIHGGQDVVRNALLLLRLARSLDIPVLLTTQYAKGLGATLPEVLAEIAGPAPVDKVSFGCFGDSGFLERLRGLAGRDQLLLAGVESHVCVAQTALGGLDEGYAVHVASDAVGSRTEANRLVGLTRMDRAGAVLSSAEMAIYELLGRSDSDAFKAMLPHLKG
jgi:nicotinamidase-related amidase